MDERTEWSDCDDVKDAFQQLLEALQGDIDGDGDGDIDGTDVTLVHDAIGETDHGLIYLYDTNIDGVIDSDDEDFVYARSQTLYSLRNEAADSSDINSGDCDYAS